MAENSITYISDLRRRKCSPINSVCGVSTFDPERRAEAVVRVSGHAFTVRDRPEAYLTNLYLYSQEDPVTSRIADHGLFKPSYQQTEPWILTGNINL